MSTIIKTTDLTKLYGPQNSVIHLNIYVIQGDIYGFLGRNGAGK
ncbi:ABC transporter ATP-binding protein, partial [Bacillus paralicheniformis]|nr:ABC transporter ATP-binding protein [Bacillus paralicheniformis]